MATLAQSSTGQASLAPPSTGQASLAQSRRVKAGDLAEALHTTTGFVTQVVNPLVKAGWVRSDPGPWGGYALTAVGTGITVLDVIEAVDGPTDDGRCVVQDRDCTGADRCILHDAWRRARHELLHELGSRRACDALPEPPGPGRVRSQPPLSPPNQKEFR